MKKGQGHNVRGAKKLEREWFRRQDQLRKKAAKRVAEKGQHETEKDNRGTREDRRRD
jgi:hypothetical protein